MTEEWEDIPDDETSGDFAEVDLKYQIFSDEVSKEYSYNAYR